MGGGVLPKMVTGLFVRVAERTFAIWSTKRTISTTAPTAALEWTVTAMTRNEQIAECRQAISEGMEREGHLAE